MRHLLFLIALFFVLVACNRNPYKATNKSYQKQMKSYTKNLRNTPRVQGNDSIKSPAYFVGTTNYNLRKPNFVIIHHTAQNSCEQTLKTFTTIKSQVSAHYVICKDGTVHQMLNDYMRAWHGGNAKWGNLTDINSASIGIELDNNGFQPFDSLQMNSLLSLLNKLKKNYAIPAANFIGHSDIAPTRKVDPNVTFPWKKLADNGYGLWYDDTTNITVPADFNAVQALRIIGYDVRDAGAAIAAFKRHFLGEDKSKTLTDADKKVLYVLMRKYL